MKIKENYIPEIIFCDCGDDMVITEENDSVVLFECPTCLNMKEMDKWDISEVEEEYKEITNEEII